MEDSRGRRHAETPHPYRNDFQRDRDRVVHARAFRRLEAKTQVFTRRYSDHFRNRLTQARRDVEHALSVTVDYFKTRAEQERALGILKFKLDVLWAMNDAMALGYANKP